MLTRGLGRPRKQRWGFGLKVVDFKIRTIRAIAQGSLKNVS